MSELILESEQRLLRGMGGILGRAALIDLINSGELAVNPMAENYPNNIDPVSFDVHLGEAAKIVTDPINMREELSPDQIQTIDLGILGHYDLQPGEHILCVTKERIGMPAGYYGEIWSKGSIARAGS